jgi:NodT family efflux transporter outer membrane factor (OMF) lipoprotein
VKCKVGVLSAGFALTLISCSLAPDYKRPDLPMPDSYKEAAGGWLPAAPEMAAANRGAWWEVYKDTDLNALEEKVTAANQDLKAALAQYDEARALSDVAHAGYFPTITAGADPARRRLSRTVASPDSKTQFNDFLAGTNLSYEVDVWGRVRNAVKAGETRAQASASDLAAVDLSLHAELATDYFSLRGADAAQKIVDETVVAYEKALKLTKSLHDGGAAPEVDVDRAETQLESAKTLLADTRLKRAQLEHAIAVLTGEMPSSFTLPANVAVVNSAVPPVLPDLPSTLLQQRPDIAAAELRVQAANADIGVARAAYFPDFSISAAIGFESAVMSKLLQSPSLFWSVGPQAAQTVFDGGKIAALSDRAHAAYDEAVANYRQTVLIAFQEVEDNLAALRELALENETQALAAAAAERTLAQAKDRYSGGIATYLDVVVAENTALQAELAAIDVRTRRLNADVLLVKALGGVSAASSTSQNAGTALSSLPPSLSQEPSYVSFHVSSVHPCIRPWPQQPVDDSGESGVVCRVPQD